MLYPGSADESWPGEGLPAPLILDQLLIDCISPGVSPVQDLRSLTENFESAILLGQI
jgi:hypothetical protein